VPPPLTLRHTHTARPLSWPYLPPLFSGQRSGRPSAFTDLLMAYLLLAELCSGSDSSMASAGAAARRKPARTNLNVGADGAAEEGESAVARVVSGARPSAGTR
jgi:hypothetical protein